MLETVLDQVRRQPDDRRRDAGHQSQHAAQEDQPAQDQGVKLEGDGGLRYQRPSASSPSPLSLPVRRDMDIRIRQALDQRLRQDRPRRVRARARALRRLHPVDRRHGEAARGERREGHRGRRLHRLPGDARRPVKTLHPKIHGGLLARRDLPAHMAAIKEAGTEPIDLVVVNLYPFRRRSRSPGCTLEEAIENIDIGGPTMVRAAAKNHAGVAVVTDPADYARILDEMRANGGALAAATRLALAKKAFSHTAAYDAAIANYLTAPGRRSASPRFPRAPDAAVREGAGAALRREPAPARGVLPRPRAGRRAASPATPSSRARSCRTTTSPTPTRRGSASRRSTRRRA